MTAAPGGAGRADRSDRGRRLLDEAVRLLDVVQAVQVGRVPEDGGAPEGAGHVPDGDCRWCPLCRGVAALREVDPEAMTRIAGAVGDLAGAVRDLFAGPGGPAAPPEADGDDPDGGDPDGAAPADTEPADTGPADTGGGDEPAPVVRRIVVTD